MTERRNLVAGAGRILADVPIKRNRTLETEVKSKRKRQHINWKRYQVSSYNFEAFPWEENKRQGKGTGKNGRGKATTHQTASCNEMARERYR